MKSHTVLLSSHIFTSCLQNCCVIGLGWHRRRKRLLRAGFNTCVEVLRWCEGRKHSATACMCMVGMFNWIWWADFSKMFWVNKNRNKYNKKPIKYLQGSFAAADAVLFAVKMIQTLPILTQLALCKLTIDNEILISLDKSKTNLIKNNCI